MRLLPRAALRSDSEQLLIFEKTRKKYDKTAGKKYLFYIF
jgi:hypothetical protein